GRRRVVDSQQATARSPTNGERALFVGPLGDTRRAAVGKPTKAQYRRTIDALKCTQTNEQQASKGKPRGRKIPLERAQMNANAFTLARAGTVCVLLHKRPARPASARATLGDSSSAPRVPATGTCNVIRAQHTT